MSSAVVDLKGEVNATKLNPVTLSSPVTHLDSEDHNLAYLERRMAMIEHIVLFRWTEEASQEAMDNAIAELRKLNGKIPGIMDLSCGANFSDRAKGYTHGLAVRLVDRSALEAYGPHPEHQRVLKNFINPIRADILALDYEF
jgi:hypothetical protein